MDLNAAYILDRYRDYQSDPRSLDPEWQAYFQRSDDVVESTNGPAPVELPPGVRPLQGIALRIAQNMDRSLQVPSATSYREMPVKLLEENRGLINSFLKAADAGKLSFTHVIGWAVVRALQRHPALNRSYLLVDGKPAIAEHVDVNLGLAIDVERSDGTHSLVVPNIKRANTLEFAEFRAAYESHVRRARRGQLTPDDLTGTTITLTNPGTIGTVASVPRLMVGQGTILATGGIHYPAEFQAADAETLSDLGVSKVMFISSTYDHRIIQGAESGLFLAWLEALLLGEEGFYEEVFRSLRIPYRPLGWQRDRHRGIDASEKQQQVLSLIQSFRSRGYLQTHLDPLGYELHYHPDLDPLSYGLTIWDFDRTFLTGGLGGQPRLPLRDILNILRDTYTQRLGVEYMHIQPPDERRWLQQRMETGQNQPGLDPDEKRHVLRKLSEAETFERFLATKYLGHKRFSLEGAETAIPMLDELIQQAGQAGVGEVILGMAHRGRLNVLANIIGKSPQKIFAEFEDLNDPASVHGSGDVKYHVGASGVVSVGDREVRLLLSPNPSHLEAVNPVVEGLARARQDAVGDEVRSTVLPVLIHGDAAFAGQGVVAETLNLSQLIGYRTGGTIHLVINNQIGFTAAPEVTRSMTSATDIAKMIEAPILHVNGDDPEAAVHAMRIALEYRQRFRRDVVVDLVCYRRHGHNETDDPSYTQPIMYRKIRSHPSTRKVYIDRLQRTGILTAGEVATWEQQFADRLEELLTATRAQEPPPSVQHPLTPHGDEGESSPPVDAGASSAHLERSLEVLSRVPADIDVHPKLLAAIERRPELAHQARIDWALAEQLAFGTLLLEGHGVRLSGQDCQRGTFSQRHAVLLDQRSGRMYVPLQHLSDRQATFQVYDSPLSEYAVVGFEYGYSVAQPDTLVMWEAQFGDFVNGAQIIIDQFLSSGEDKWSQTCGLVLLLPHGFEGQGPEHSSARLERFLTLCAGGNLQVVVPSTPAQYFHVLRRQMHRPLRKPLVVLTPKSLLRHPQVVSGLEDLRGGRFEPVLVDAVAGARRVLLCSGKVYYDLLQARQGTDVAIVRIEQLYPLPTARLRELLADATDTVWVQEEPRNMGAWPFLHERAAKFLPPGRSLGFVGRPPSGSPASGSHHQHALEQSALLQEAFGAGAPVGSHDP